MRSALARSVLAFAFAVSALPQPAGAQSARALSSLSAGERVRYTVNLPEPHRYVGIVAATGGDALFLRTEFDSTALPLPFERIVRLEVSVATVRHVKRDAIIGALAGVAGGIVLAAARPSSSEPRPCPATVLGECLAPQPRRNYAADGAIGGSAGLLLGAAAGRFDRSDRWLVVSLPSMPAHSSNPVRTSSIMVRMPF